MDKDSTEPYFTKFRRKRSGNENFTKSKTADAVSTILSSYGSDVYDCKENFIKQDILYEDLGSLSGADLEKLGIKEIRKRNELLQQFSELPNQDYTLRDVMNVKESQDVNNKIFERCSSYSENMRLALSAANMKLQIAPSGDIIVDDRNYASKFVVDAVAELMKTTEDIENRLEILELISCEHENRSTVWKTLGLASLIILGASWFIKRY